MTPPTLRAPTCTSSDLQIIDYANSTIELWEQRTRPEETGKYVEPDDPFVFKFGENVNKDLVGANLTVKSVNRIKKKDGQWVPCNVDPGAGTIEEAIHEVQIPAKYYMGLPLVISLRHDDDPFVMGCAYELVLKKGPLTTGDKCLPEDVHHTFTITPDTMTSFERETTDVSWDLKTGEIRAFRIKPNVQLKTDEVWRRYREEIGWRVSATQIDKIIQVGEPKEDPTAPGSFTSQWKQKYKDVPVEGGGFVVDTKEEFVESVIGRFVPGLDLNVTPAVSEPEALEAAKAAVGVQESEYIAETSPSAHLLIVPTGTSQEAKDFRLAYKFKIAARRPLQKPLSKTVVVDAQTKEILRQVSRIRYLDPPSADDIPLVPFTDEPGEGSTLYDSTKTDFKVGRSSDSGGAPYFLLRNHIGTPPATELPDNPDAGKITTLYYSQATGLQPIYNEFDNVFDGAEGNPPGQREGVSVHWAIQRAVGYINQLFGRDADDPPLFPSDLPLLAVVIKDAGELSTAHYEKCGDYLNGFPTGMASLPCLMFRIDHPELGPSVSPDIVGHEVYHLLMSHFGWVDEESLDGRTIEEGLADVFAKLLEFHIRGDRGTWEMGKDYTLDHQGYRNLATPENSTDGPFPSAYEDDAWGASSSDCVATTDDEEAFLCLTHARSTVVGHAFYLMVHGGEGVNSLGCDYNVMPLDAVTGTNTESRRKAGDILWKTITRFFPFGQKKDLPFLRYATMLAALKLSTEPVTIDARGLANYPPEVKTVLDAWHAVGVGNRSSELLVVKGPKQGEKKAEPWPLGISVGVPNETHTWQVQISSRDDFKCGPSESPETHIEECETNVDFGLKPFLSQKEFNVTSVSQIGADARVEMVNAVTFYLKPRKRYYWRYRIKPTDPALTNEWGKCEAVYFFDTASKAPDLTSPRPSASITAGGVSPAHLSFGDSIEWKEVEGATKYFVRISDKPDDLCAPAEGEAETPATGPRKFKFVTAPRLDPEAEGFALEPEKTYYWYAKAIKTFPTEAGGSIDLWGDCSNGDAGIPFKAGKIPAPTPISPQQNALVEYNPPFRFEWNSVNNAIAYEVQVSRTLSGEPTDQWSSYPVESAETHTDIALEMPEYGYCWKVQATLSNDRKTEWSEPKCFTLELLAPQISSPDDGQHISYGHYQTGDYLWISVPGAASYNLQLYQRNQDGSVGSSMNTISVPDIESDQARYVMRYPLRDGVWFCWAVEGVSSGGHVGPPSETECFGVTPAVPECREALDYMDDSNSRVTLRWDSDYSPWGFSTDIKVYAYHGNLVGSDTTSHTGNDKDVDVTGQRFYKRITWQVSALDPLPGGQPQTGPLCEWVNPREFEQEGAEEEAAPLSTSGSCTTLGTPPTGISPAALSAWSALNDGPPLYPLRWNSTSGASSYVVKIFNFNQFGLTPLTLVHTSQDLTSTEYMPPQVLMGGGHFQWTVTAKNSCGQMGSEGFGGWYCAYISCW